MLFSGQVKTACLPSPLSNASSLFFSLSTRFSLPPYVLQTPQSPSWNERANVTTIKECFQARKCSIFLKTFFRENLHVGIEVSSRVLLFSWISWSSPLPPRVRKRHCHVLQNAIAWRLRPWALCHLTHPLPQCQ